MKTNELAKHYAEVKAKAERLSREAYEAGKAEKSARKNLEAIVYRVIDSNERAKAKSPEKDHVLMIPEGPGVVLVGDHAVAFNIKEGEIEGLTVLDEIPTWKGRKQII